MSDRISIDHVSNTVTIKVHSINISNMSNTEILAWIKRFADTVTNTDLDVGIIKDVPPSHQP